MGYRILDVTDQAGFDRIPPCADAGFDHRSCDYWEDERGSKAARLSWLSASAPAASSKPSLADNPFAPAGGHSYNPFAKGGAANAGGAPVFGGPVGVARPANPFSLDEATEIDNPFAPRRETRAGVASDAPRKLQLLGRGLAVFGSYAKVLEVDDASVAWCQFGPLSAYPRAQRVRDLYPQLPSSPLPAVITCIATTAEARRHGYAKRLILSVVDDLAGRGFSAVGSSFMYSP